MRCAARSPRAHAPPTSCRRTPRAPPPTNWATRSCASWKRLPDPVGCRRYFALCRITTHSPDPAAFAAEDPVLPPDAPDCIDTEGPFGPIVVEPLRPPEPLVIVVEVGDPDQMRV